MCDQLPDRWSWDAIEVQTNHEGNSSVVVLTLRGGCPRVTTISMDDYDDETRHDAPGEATATAQAPPRGKRCQSSSGSALSVSSDFRCIHPPVRDVIACPAFADGLRKSPRWSPEVFDEECRGRFRPWRDRKNGGHNLTMRSPIQPSAPSISCCALRHRMAT